MKRIPEKRNNLGDLVLTGSEREFDTDTIKMLFRAVTEPVLEMPAAEGLVLIRLFDLKDIKSVLRRLEFSDVKLYAYNDEVTGGSVVNAEKENIWEKTEFVLILAPRYSAALIWDNKTDGKETSNICLHVNTREITDIAGMIFDNSTVNLNPFLTNYAPDRRSQVTLNNAVEKIACLLDDAIKENEFSKAQTPRFDKAEELLSKYEKIYDKSKIIAHEIKNNVSVIDLYSKILEKRLNNAILDSETKKSITNAISSINDAAFAISSHISELNEKRTVFLSEKQLSEIADNVVNLAAPKAKTKNVSLESFIDPEFRVHADELKLQSILLNLIYNAVDACDQNGRITLRAEKSDNNTVKISVRNSGEQIPPDIAPKIFDENFTTKIDGNGMGLYICKKLAKEQFGDCVLAKSDENGSEFNVFLRTV
ncbi:MAG: sensor histidine kinase [Candidatus Gastranaerophilaceae bacterium]